jgi:hypothetical protein
MSKAGTMMDDTKVATMIRCLTTKTRAKISKDVVEEPEKSDMKVKGWRWAGSRGTTSDPI